MNKCDYCHKEIRELHPAVAGKEKVTLSCCSEICVKKLLAFYRFFERTKVLFMIGLALSMLMLFIAVILLSASQMLPGSVLMGSSISLLGLIIAIFPFATPQTFTLLGFRKTVWVTRLLGFCLILLGPLISYWVRT